MATHKKICSIRFPESKVSFCFDKVIRDDKDGEIEFAFVWRNDGSERHLRNPAYFTLDILGELLRKAIKEKCLTKKDINEFLNSFIGIE
jgi:hypothetical protein